MEHLKEAFFSTAGFHAVRCFHCVESCLCFPYQNFPRHCDSLEKREWIQLSVALCQPIILTVDTHASLFQSPGMSHGQPSSYNGATFLYRDGVEENVIIYSNSWRHENSVQFWEEIF